MCLRHIRTLLSPHLTQDRQHEQSRVCFSSVAVISNENGERERYFDDDDIKRQNDASVKSRVMRTSLSQMSAVYIYLTSVPIILTHNSYTERFNQ